MDTSSNKTQTILRLFLAFVVIWFGLQEIFTPDTWVTFVPTFLGQGSLALDLVIVHGIILTVCAVLLIFKLYTRLAAWIVVVLLLEIIINLIFKSGFSGLVVRDIGILGMALAIAL